MDKMKLVIFGDDWDVYTTSYRELIENPLISYIPTFRPKGILGLLQRIQFNPRLNKIVKLPFKQCWNTYYLRNIREKKICFLILERWLRLESGFCLLPFLRERYPHSYIVCFTQDLITRIRDQYTDKPISPVYLKKYSDLVISYDVSDAKKYGFKFHPTIYSTIPRIENGKEKYDMFFLGRNKGRLDILVKICKGAKKVGMKCNFILIEVPAQERVRCDGITYIEHEIPYNENLRYCAESRCIVEVLQDDAESPTFRLWESIMLNKKLVTTNALLQKNDFYDKSYISIFSDESNFDWEFVKKELDFPNGQNPFRDDIRPEHLLEFIEEELKIKLSR